MTSQTPGEIMENVFGDVGKLGFGLMRLPTGEDGKIDVEQTKTMVDLFMESGFTYFDTAYVYDGGKSEEALRSALVERYPRDCIDHHQGSAGQAHA